MVYALVRITQNELKKTKQNKQTKKNRTSLLSQHLLVQIHQLKHQKKHVKSVQMVTIESPERRQ